MLAELCQSIWLVSECLVERLGRMCQGVCWLCQSFLAGRAEHFAGCAKFFGWLCQSCWLSTATVIWLAVQRHLAGREMIGWAKTFGWSLQSRIAGLAKTFGWLCQSCWQDTAKTFGWLSKDCWQDTAKTVSRTLCRLAWLAVPKIWLRTVKSLGWQIGWQCKVYWHNVNWPAVPKSLAGSWLAVLTYSAVLWQAVIWDWSLVNWLRPEKNFKGFLSSFLDRVHVQLVWQSRLKSSQCVKGVVLVWLQFDGLCFSLCMAVSSSVDKATGPHSSWRLWLAVRSAPAKNLADRANVGSAKGAGRPCGMVCMSLPTDLAGRAKVL
jgi:hypothetical protein